MDSYDDRPISVYDNLNTPPSTYTSTPKARSHTTMSTVSTNGTAAQTPYNDVRFHFDDNNKLHEQQQVQPLQLLLHPNSNRSSNQTAAQVQSNTITPQYATPHKSITPGIAIASSHATPQRPLSQHSQSELNEASQNIAAVKAALNDAKSKFFGLNGYTQDNPSNNNDTEQTYKLLPNIHSYNKPQVQIITKPPAPTPPPKPQPKYQNIPENSAIFRSNHQPPELPPKPIGRQNTQKSNEFTSISPGATSPSSSNRTAMEPDTPANLILSTRAHSPSNNDTKMSPFTTYTHVPLNDIDTTQPSQAVYMSTTVPQNIKGSKIAGRHTPTRNSLRHSRMLVVNNRNYQGLQHPNPMNFKYPNLARVLLILQIIIGLLIGMLAIWLFFLAPNTAIQDNPYWSGLALLCSGILGVGLVRYQRIKRHKVREKFFLFLRAKSYILSILAIVLCSIALICAAIHFARITAADTICESTNKLVEHSSCICTFNAVNDINDASKPVANATLYGDAIDSIREEIVEEGNFIDESYKVEYRDLSCQEISCEWTYVLGISIGLNSLGFIVSLLYVVLLICCRHSNSKRFYSSVHTSTF